MINIHEAECEQLERANDRITLSTNKYVRCFVNVAARDNLARYLDFRRNTRGTVSRAK